MINQGGNLSFSDVESRPVCEPYDKSAADLSLIFSVINVSVIQDFQWRIYIGLIERGFEFKSVETPIGLAVEEQNHGDTIAGLADRSETQLEKVAAAQGAYISLLVELLATEIDEEIKAAYERILFEHLGHRASFAAKLAHKEGLSPMARTGFSLKGGKSLSCQLVDVAGVSLKPYERDKVLPAAKIGIRLALAHESALRRDYRARLINSGDNHLNRLYRQAATVDNLHIAMLYSMIDHRETFLESAFLGEMAEIVLLRRVLTEVGEGPVHDVFSLVLEQDMEHLKSLRRWIMEREGRNPDEFSHPWPEFKSIKDQAD